jgi:septum site-determining protein MinD
MKHITAIISGKGGVGKTMLAAAFGLAEARRGKRVLLLDLDMGMGNLDLALGLSPKYSMLGLVMGKCREKDAVQHVKDGLDFLAAHFKRDWRDIKKSDVAKVLEDYADDYDLILLDCPAGRGKGMEFAAKFADSFILVIGPSKAAVINAKRTAQMLPKANIRAVYNDFSADGTYTFEEAKEAVKSIPFGGIVPHSEEIDRLLQEGRMAEYDETSPFGRAIALCLDSAETGETISPEVISELLETGTKSAKKADTDSFLHPASRLHRARLSARYGRRGMR